MQGDSNVQLVVLCAEKPTSAVLKRVVSELPAQLKKIADDAKYTVTMAPVEGAVIVSDGVINVKVSLTSPLLREQAAAAGKLRMFQSQINLILLFQIKRKSSGQIMKSFSISSYQFHTFAALNVYFILT